MKKIITTYGLLLLPLLVFGQVADMNLLKAKACIDQNKTDSALHLLYGSGLSAERAMLMGDCLYKMKAYTEAGLWYLVADSITAGKSSYELARTYARMSNAGKATSWLKKYLALPAKKSELEIVKDSAFMPVSGTNEWKQVWQNEWYSSSEIERNTVQALIAKGKIADAMAELEENQGKFLPRHEYFYLQATVYDKQQLPELSIAAMEKAVTFNSFSDIYYIRYADILQKNKKYREALDCMNKAIRINPYSLEYYVKRGEVARLANNYALSEKDLMLYKNLYPESTEVYHQLGLLETERGNRQNALDYYDLLIAKDKVHDRYFIERGNLALSMDQVQKADEDYSLALDLNPKALEAYLNKGKTLLILNDSQGACFFWTKAREFGSAEAAKLIQANCKEQ